MQSTLSIFLNGQLTKITEPTVDALIRARYQKPEHVVAELNGKVISRINWPQTPIQAGDRLELLSFVGGG